MRVFTALPLPRRAAGLLAETLPLLRRAGSGLEPVRADGLHVTLHFFGEIEEAAAAALRRALEDPRLPRPPIRAELGGWGRFPPSGTPGVIFRRIEAGAGEAASFRELFLSVIAPLGYRPEARPFAAHVTLARNRGGAVDFPAIPQAAPLEFFFEECVLYRSILERGGARYESLHRIPFREVKP